MAELGEFSNFPTYPGLDPWVRANFEQDLSEDYRIDEKNVPCTAFAVKHGILSTSYDFDSDAFVGTVIPLPSLILTGGGISLIIQVRTTYRNWLNTGTATVISTSNGQSQRTGIVPPTISYQVLDKYKEVVHYGMDMLIFAVSTSIGTVRPIAVSSFIPFLEHRTQALFNTVVLVDGTVSSVSYKDNQIVFKMDWGGNSVDIKKPYKDKYSVKLTVFSPYAKEYDVAYVDEVGTVYVDAKDLSPEDLEKLNGAVGNYFYLGNGIQIMDPAMLYTELGDGKYSEGTLGYETREQEVSATGDLKSFFYNRESMEKTLLERVKFLEESSKSSSSSSSASSDASNQSEKPHELYTLYAEAEKDDISKLVEYVKSAKEVYGSYAEENLGGENSKLLLSALASLQDESTHVRIGVGSSRGRLHNFGPGTQQGSIFRFNGDEDRHQYYKVLFHPRDEIFLLSNGSIGAEDPSNQEPKRVDLQETLYDFPESRWNINSNRMWTVSDITTSTTSNTSSFDSGIFKGKIVGTTSVPADKEKNGEDDEDTMILQYKVSDTDYYGYEHLRERYLADAEPSGGTVKSWKKFNGWSVYRRGREYSTGYPVEKIEYGQDGEMYITINGIHEDLVIDNEEYEGNIKADWWIGLGERIDSRPTTLDYVGTPFLGLNAVLGESQDPSGGFKSTILFDGIYVGSPLSYSLSENSVIRLISNTPTLFELSGQAEVSVSSSKSFKYISFDEEIPLDTQIILYNRDDDASNALYARSGQVGYLYKLDEFLVYSGTPEWVKASVEGPSGPTRIQTISKDGDAPGESDDVVAIEIVKKNKENKETDADGKYKQTIWTVSHGDRILGYESQSGIENSIYTRSFDEFIKKDMENISLYRLSQMFSGERRVRYPIPGNALTGDPLVRHPSFKFIPVLDWDPVHAVIGEAYYGVAKPGMVLRDVKSRTAFKYVGIGRILLTNQSQKYVDSSVKMSTVSVFEPVDSSETEYRESQLGEGDLIVNVDLNQDGVFMSSTDDFYIHLVNGIQDTYPSKNNIPVLICPNMSEASYDINYPYVDIAGYTKMVSGSEEIVGLVFRRYNIMNFIDAEYQINKSGDKNMFAVPSKDRALSDTVVIGNSEKSGQNPYGKEKKPAFFNASLYTDPFDLVGDSRHQIIIRSSTNYLNYLVSMVGGEVWAYMDDIRIVRASAGVVSSPSARIIGDVMHLFYFDGVIDMMYKRIPATYFTSLFSRYRGKQSSKEEDDGWKKQKEELQAKFDKIESSKIAESFEQKVAFGVTSKGRLRVVYYSEDGQVQSATSNDGGLSWTLDTENF